MTISQLDRDAAARIGDPEIFTDYDADTAHRILVATALETLQTVAAQGDIADLPEDATDDDILRAYLALF